MTMMMRMIIIITMMMMMMMMSIIIIIESGSRVGGEICYSYLSMMMLKMMMI